MGAYLRWRIRQLGSPKPEKRLKAIRILVYWTDPNAIKPLTELLSNDPEEKVRTEAAAALGTLCGPVAAKALADALKDPCESVSMVAAIALGKIRSPDTAQAIATAFSSSKHARNHYELQTALINIGMASVPFVVPLLSSADFYTRIEAQEILEKVGWRPRERCEVVLFEIARERWETAAKLGSNAVEPLIAVLKDRPEPAAKALGITRDPRAVEPLLAYLFSEDDRTRKTVAEALILCGFDPAHATTDQAAAFAIAQESFDVLTKFGSTGARLLLQLAPWAGTKLLPMFGSDAVEPLLSALRDRRDAIREMAARVLGMIKDGSSFDPLLSVFENDDSWDVREHAAKALQSMGWQPANDYQRAKVAVSRKEWDEIVRIGPVAVPVLCEALYDRMRRVDAIEKLGEIADSKAIRSLLDVHHSIPATGPNEDDNGVKAGDIKKALVNILKKDAKKISIQDLDTLTKLTAINVYWDDQDEQGFYCSHHLTYDYSEVRDLARKELNNRALK
ncbi:HEAT repeat domain-containing protein [bacterium]|nr:HEAT repeat domain-containing protein [bacterium]